MLAGSFTLAVALPNGPGLQSQHTVACCTLCSCRRVDDSAGLDRTQGAVASRPEALRLRGGGLLFGRKSVAVARFEPPPPYSSAVAKDSAWTDVKVCFSAIARLVLRLAWYVFRMVARVLIRVAYAVVHVVAGVVGGTRRSGVYGLNRGTQHEQTETDWFVSSLDQRAGTGETDLAAAPVDESHASCSKTSAYLEAVSPVLFSPDRSRQRHGKALPEHLWRRRADEVLAATAAAPADACSSTSREERTQLLATGLSRQVDSVHPSQQQRGKSDLSPKGSGSLLSKAHEPFTPSQTFFTPSPFCAFSEGKKGAKAIEIARIVDDKRARGGGIEAPTEAVVSVPLTEPFCSSVSD